MSEGVRERVSRLETDMTGVEEYVYELMETAETYRLALRRVAEENLNVSMDRTSRPSRRMAQTMR